MHSISFSNKSWLEWVFLFMFDLLFVDLYFNFIIPMFDPLLATFTEGCGLRWCRSILILEVCLGLERTLSIMFLLLFSFSLKFTHFISFLALLMVLIKRFKACWGWVLEVAALGYWSVQSVSAIEVILLNFLSRPWDVRMESKLAVLFFSTSISFGHSLSMQSRTFFVNRLRLLGTLYRRIDTRNCIRKLATFRIYVWRVRVSFILLSLLSLATFLLSF